MRYKQKLDTKFRTFSNKNRMKRTIDLAKKFQEDPEKENRFKENQCKFCYYVTDRVGGDALTEVECAGCNAIIFSSNTDVDVLCLPCAINLNLCKHCGAEL